MNRWRDAFCLSGNNLLLIAQVPKQTKPWRLPAIHVRWMHLFRCVLFVSLVSVRHVVPTPICCSGTHSLAFSEGVRTFFIEHDINLAFPYELKIAISCAFACRTFLFITYRDIWILSILCAGLVVAPADDVYGDEKCRNFNILRP